CARAKIQWVELNYFDYW
nr:immunoglobulin heavy chain junction region [Macaca mulatta]